MDIRYSIFDSHIVAKTAVHFRRVKFKTLHPTPGTGIWWLLKKHILLAQEDGAHPLGCFLFS